MAMRYGFDASISANVLTSDPVEFPCLNMSEWPRDHTRACVRVCVYTLAFGIMYIFRQSCITVCL